MEGLKTRIFLYGGANDKTFIYSDFNVNFLHLHE
jgi:hypothetical protein